MRRSPLAVLALVSLPALAQVSVVEPSTRAQLADGKTTITVAIQSHQTKPVDGWVQLSWLAPDGKPLAQASREIAIPTGASTVSVPLPLPEKQEPLLLRLSYRLTPRGTNFSAFQPNHGILSYAHLAPDAFNLHVILPALPATTARLEVVAACTHPVTSAPIAGVRIDAEDQHAVTGKDGLATLHLAARPDSDLGVTGTLGDFRQHTAVDLPDAPAGRITIQTDKPLYQPGQMLHLRFLELGPDGHAVSGPNHRIRILDSDDLALHTAHVTTSRFGIGFTDWQIPENTPSGKYTIEVESPAFDDPITRPLEIRRYELPNFRVTAKPDRPFYLQNQSATLRISAEYLFGKPVAAGAVRIVEDEKTLAQGKLDPAGVFTATLATGKIEVETPYGNYENPNDRFRDRHLTAFVTDASTNRTEQRKFDLRVSREILHVYVAGIEATIAGRVLYVTVFTPDGTPTRATVQALNKGNLLASAETNALGITRLLLPYDSPDKFTITARTPHGATATIQGRCDLDLPDLLLETDRALYRTGDVIHVTIAATTPASRVVLFALNDRQETVLSHTVVLENGRAEWNIPYTPRLGRLVTINAASTGSADTATRVVAFPGAGEFTVRATPAQAVYRPGESASIRVHASAEAALGVAIVDESVYERHSTDSPFRDPTYSNATWNGMSVDDLINLDPAKINPDLELVARMLFTQPGGSTMWNRHQHIDEAPFLPAARKALQPVQNTLERNYRNTLRYPRNDAEYGAVVVFSDARDPWEQPFQVHFSLEDHDAVVRWTSNGPDKKPGTEDDFEVLTSNWRWFGPYVAILHRHLDGLPRFPETIPEFTAAIAQSPLRFEALRDPWGTALRITTDVNRTQRIFHILSAGPDHQFGTRDDVPVDSYQSEWFAEWHRKINTAFDGATPFPLTAAQFRTQLRAAGIDFDALRDPWNHPLDVLVSADEVFADRTESYTHSTYGGPTEERTGVTPVKHRVVNIVIRTSGPDGILGTFDDAEIARYSRFIARPRSGTPPPPVPDLDEAPGTGRLTGIVVDPTGATITGARVTLDGQRTTNTDADGRFRFSAVLPGKHIIRVEFPGFRNFVMEGIPVSAGRIAHITVTLDVGAITQAIEVNAAVSILSTESASVSEVRAATSTPRVRDYFPETLYWQPELLTSPTGDHSIAVQLADTLTTWRISVMASTADGRIAETTTSLKAFQPFQAELDVPAALTIGDRISLPVPIRNYLDRAQAVKLSATLPAVAAAGRPLRFTVPATALPGSLQAELKFYPSLLARIVESVEALLERPHGCGEQTISSTYPSLLLLKALDRAHMKSEVLTSRARRYLLQGYQRLLGYRHEDGGFTYWGHGEPDLALTAYAITFLREAKTFIDVDETVIHDAQHWLAREQAESPATAAIRLRSLDPNDKKLQLDDLLGALGRDATLYDSPYALATFALAALDHNRPELAARPIQRLIATATDEQGAAYWHLRTNTPYYGGGYAGREETTALAITALARWRTTHPDPALDALIDRATLFLLRRGAHRGGWSTTQSTVRVLTALIETWKPEPPLASTLRVLVNGRPAGTVEIPTLHLTTGPIRLDLSKAVTPGRENEITIDGLGTRALQAQLSSSWYEPWPAATPLAKELEFQVTYSTLKTAIQQPVECRLQAGRKTWRGYGMMIAEAGLPPGAEVDRASLTALVADPKSGVNSFEVAPDRVIFYLWPRAAGTDIRFLFRPRYAIEARTAPSALYLYYDPDERIDLAPPLFQVQNGI